MTFKEYLAKCRVTDNPRGDFIKDARRDDRMPDIKSRGELLKYLSGRGAILEARQEAGRLWLEYERRVSK